LAGKFVMGVTMQSASWSDDKRSGHYALVKLWGGQTRKGRNPRFDDPQGARTRAWLSGGAAKIFSG